MIYLKQKLLLLLLTGLLLQSSGCIEEKNSLPDIIKSDYKGDISKNDDDSSDNQSDKQSSNIAPVGITYDISDSTQDEENTANKNDTDLAVDESNKIEKSYVIGSLAITLTDNKIAAQFIDDDKLKGLMKDINGVQFLIAGPEDFRFKTLKNGVNVELQIETISKSTLVDGKYKYDIFPVAQFDKTDVKTDSKLVDANGRVQIEELGEDKIVNHRRPRTSGTFTIVDGLLLEPTKELNKTADKSIESEVKQ